MPDAILHEIEEDLLDEGFGIDLNSTSLIRNRYTGHIQCLRRLDY